MVKEEFLIEQKFGRVKPFRTPNGYFEEFEKNILDKIPTQPKTSNKRFFLKYLRPMSWAACIAAVILSVVIFSDNIHINPDKRVADASQGNVTSLSNSDYIIDEMSDYAMLDNDDIYYLIADE